MSTDYPDRGESVTATLGAQPVSVYVDRCGWDHGVYLLVGTCVNRAIGALLTRQEARRLARALLRQARASERYFAKVSSL